MTHTAHASAPPTPAPMSPSTSPTRRKTRIVCISDTHNATPKLPPGDVLIHAGDLTKQGSYAELKRTMAWLEKADFEVKIVIAGNHDMTLDAAFFEEHGARRYKWPAPQDPAECIELVREAKGITYLDHEAVTVCLKSGVRFKVFGSPYSWGRRGWAFQYEEQDAAEKLWSQIPLDADIVITHTPPKGICDTPIEGDSAGCSVLLQRLGEVRPVLSVCGHIHEARGAERVCWKCGASAYWDDPGAGNKKLSLVDMTGKQRQRQKKALTGAGHDSGRGQAATRQRGKGQIEGAQPEVDNLNPTSSLTDRALGESEAEGQAQWSGGVWQHGCGLEAGLDCGEGDEDAAGVVVNASIAGPRLNGRPSEDSKPMVVDLML